MKSHEFINKGTYQPPELQVGDTIKKGKFKNLPAEIKGFTKDKNNQPVLKTNKGDVKLFNPRIDKLTNANVIKENGILSAVKHAMPPAYSLPQLKNQDPYLQYRFGLALAAARAHNEGLVDYSPESSFGENMIVVTRTPEEEETLRLALALFGKLNDSTLITTSKSEEADDVNTQSPIQPKGPIKRVR
jgi:hypothetical protein